MIHLSQISRIHRPKNEAALPALLAVLFTLCLLAAPAMGQAQSWQKDMRRFHVSAHGQLSCADCHGQVDMNAGHPDPERVNAAPREDFDPVRCYECHGDVQDDLAEGRHGGRKLADPARYANCITCHDPHYAYQRTTDPELVFRAGVPRYEQCGVCHESQADLPELDAESQACLSCHALPLSAAAGARATDEICLSCHGEPKLAGQGLVVLEDGQADLGKHQDLTCAECHGQAAKFPHAPLATVDCLACHAPHDEAISGDAHVGVDCQACHFIHGNPRRGIGEDPWRVGLAPFDAGVEPVHLMEGAKGGEMCQRCHHPDNKLGASAMVLPPKSVLCMPCHTATFTLFDDEYSAIALAIFLIGLILALAAWLGGSRVSAISVGLPGVGPDVAGHRPPMGGRLRNALAGLVCDGLLQGRLWQFSPGRWFIHALIFFPFLARFIWGLAALLLNLCWPGAELAQAMLNKNQPLTAFFSDITGLLVLLGVAGAMLRRWLTGGKRLPGLPRPDWLALGLLAGIMVVGFLLEGMRIAMTGCPPDSSYAFMGRFLSGLFSAGPGLESAYGRVWYIHAVLCACFAAYLPFSRMFHMLVAPVALALRGYQRREH